MKVKELIEALKECDPELQVAIFDYKRNMDEGDGSMFGIYPDFEVGMVEPEADPNDPEAEVPAHWVALGFANEEYDNAEPVLSRRCRVCGCSDNDCRQCIQRTGRPCHWVEEDLCSACAPAVNSLILP
jgi:hypothetical protein